MASQEATNTTSTVASDSNALTRRPVPDLHDHSSGNTATNPSDSLGGSPYVTVPPGHHSRHVAMNMPRDDDQIDPYEKTDHRSQEKRAGPHTPFWERRRFERERARERDPAWRDHTEQYSEFPPYHERDRYVLPVPLSDRDGLRSQEPLFHTVSAPAAPPRVPPYQYGRYEDAAHPATRLVPRSRRDTFDEEAQFEDFLAWKHARERRARGHSPASRGRKMSHGAKHTKSPSPAGNDEETLRIPFLDWMGWTAKGHLVAFSGEFVGTTMFLFFAFAGTQVANVNSQADINSTTGAATGFNAAVLLYIALVFGFSLMVNVWVFYRISGGLFNPAVTLAMLLVKSLTVFRAMLLFIAQILGSIFASYLVKTIFPTNFNVRTTLSKDTSLTRGVFIEGILTAELIFAIFMLAKEKHKATFIAPVGIGLALFIAELVGVYYTGGSLNPARTFGPCVVTKTFDHEHWIYWVGPAGGAIAATVLYKFILIMQYELANPGQDEENEEKAAEKAEEAKAKVEQLEEEDREEDHRL